ncbi:MAG TPA: hypothetical protein VFI23_07960 [Rhizomicrobium sp.]|nr:hypothetical protein [Rhizomicrobium sp.]
MNRQKRKTEDDVVEGPAVVTGEHVQDRVLSPRAGARKGWSRLAVYEKEFRRGTLVCKEHCISTVAAREEEARALDRFAAARAFDEGWRICNTPFPPGVDFDRVRSSGGGVQGGFADHAREAKEFWRRVESAMGANDWLICRLVCGEGHSVAQGVMAVSPAYKFSTLARFREALDGLVDGMRRAKFPT